MTRGHRGADQFPLRLPPGMRERLKQAADNDGVSMNSMILNILEEIFPVEPDVDELLDEIDHTIALLKEIKSTSEDNSRSVNLSDAIKKLQGINENLLRVNPDDRISSVVTLTPETVLSLASLSAQKGVAMSSINQEVVNELILMSVKSLLDKRESFDILIDKVMGTKK